MTSRWLAWRTIRQHPIRGVLATIGVAFIGALLFDMLMLSHGLVDSFAALLDDAGYDIRVMASDGVSLVRTPASRSRENPPPATLGFGSPTPATTRAMPAPTTASAQGGVAPSCEHGSSVT